MMSEQANQPKPKAQVVRMKSAEMRLTAFPPTVWISHSFAPEWYEDALNEANAGTGHRSRRREILFAVCCVESYLFEWVRDEALNRQFSDLPKYFPYDDRRGIRERWKEVLRAVHSDGLIKDLPEFGKSYWAEFRSLVDYRNGLLHGKSSRPHTDILEDDQGPLPSKDDLDEIEAGWAVQVIAQLIVELHVVAGTAKPDWLVEP